MFDCTYTDNGEIIETIISIISSCFSVSDNALFCCNHVVSSMSLDSYNYLDSLRIQHGYNKTKLYLKRKNNEEIIEIIVSIIIIISRKTVKSNKHFIGHRTYLTVFYFVKIMINNYATNYIIRTKDSKAMHQLYM